MPGIFNKRNYRDFITSQSLPLWQGLILAGAISLLYALLAYSFVNETIDGLIVKKFEFYARDKFGKAPVIDKRLKVFALDDRAFQKLEGWVLRIDQWQKIIDLIAQKKPRAIFIDAMFGKTNDVKYDEEQLKSLANKYAVPVYAGAFVIEAKLPSREETDLSDAQYNRSNFELAQKDAKEPSPPAASFAEKKNKFHTYAFNPVLKDFFKGVGHIASPSAAGRIVPILNVGEGKAIPHLSLKGSKIKMTDEQLYINDFAVDTSRDQRLQVNFPNVPTLYANTYSFSSLFNAIETGKDIDVNAEDIVLLIPQFYTGNSDYAETPLPVRIPGGLIHVSLLNSILTNNWLKVVNHDGLLIVFASMIAILLLYSFNTLLFWIAALTLAVASIGMGIIAFAYFNTLVPWLWPTMSFMTTAFVSFSLKAWNDEQRARLIRQALSGSIAPELLETVIKSPKILNLEAKEKIITIMFIDMVNFSLLTGNLAPEKVFFYLKNFINGISDTILAEGGIIDRTLGDGLLCYFDDDLRKDRRHHTQRAIECAIKLQRKIYTDNLTLERSGSDAIKCTLRIGINTSPCYLGDIGSRHRIDFTIVGSGVNYAKRLEAACRPNCLLASDTTIEYLKHLPEYRNRLTDRFIKIKHQEQMVHVYEIDPLDNTAEPMAPVVAARTLTPALSKNRKWQVTSQGKMSFTLNQHAAILKEYSNEEFVFNASQYFASDDQIIISIAANDAVIAADLRENNLLNFSGQIIWVHQAGKDQFTYGVQMTKTTSTQKLLLNKKLQQYLENTHSHASAQAG